MAESTTILTVDGAHDGEHPRIPGVEIAAVLARHGVRVEVANLKMGPGGSIGDALLSQAVDGGADLLIMGAYGHARWRELLMGGATRTMLKSMTTPVLMSH
jgi:nucleotide-binding universal stress UspA family protein